MGAHSLRPWGRARAELFRYIGARQEKSRPTNLEIPDYFWTSDSSITLRELTVFERMGAKTL